MLALRRKLCEDINFAVDNKYFPVRSLGSGTFGDVHEFHTLVDSEIISVAVKRIKRVLDNPVHTRRAVRELRLMYHFRGHPNIVSLLDVDFISVEPYQGLYCYLELMEHDLASVIRVGGQVMTELHIPAIGYQLFCALKYIHSANVVHRDLKPGNVLVNRNGTIKVCDFGLARAIIGEDYDREKYTSYVTTRWYRAPEIILAVDSYHYGLDIWAGGCILAELALAKPLFCGKSTQDQMRRIVDTLGPPPPNWFKETIGQPGPNWFRESMYDPTSNRFRRYHTQNYWANDPTCLTGSSSDYLIRRKPLADIIPSGYSPHLVQLLEQILVYMPDSRPSATAVLRHEYFKEVANPKEEISCPTELNLEFENISKEDLVNYFYKEVRTMRAGVRGKV